MKYRGTLLSILFSGGISYAAWTVIPRLEANSIQAIGSTVSTVSGILFGFVMAAVTLLISAKDNTLVKNTQMTGYLPKLIKKLHITMGWLLLACVSFLTCLFIPNSIKFTFGEQLQDVKLVSMIALVGVFVFCMSICYFLRVWSEFSKFSKNM